MGEYKSEKQTLLEKDEEVKSLKKSLERSYSEEEVLEILEQHSTYLDCFIYQYIDKGDIEENHKWFKQFNK